MYPYSLTLDSDQLGRIRAGWARVNYVKGIRFNIRDAQNQSPYLEARVDGDTLTIYEHSITRGTSPRRTKLRQGQYNWLFKKE